MGFFGGVLGSVAGAGLGGALGPIGSFAGGAFGAKAGSNGSMGLGLSNEYNAAPLTLANGDQRGQAVANGIAANTGQGTGNDPFRQGQMQQLGSLQQAANGQGPSLAQALMRQAQDQNVSNQYSLAASSHGVNPALAQRQAMMSAAAGSQAIAGQAGAMGAQEQMAGRAQLSQALAQGRGQDLQGQGFYNQLGLNADQSNLNAAMGAQQINAGVASGNAAGTRQLVGGVISGIAGAGAAAATGGSSKAAAMAHGGVVPGQARVPGDSSMNDTVHTMLSPGEVVIPRSVAQHPAFMEALQKMVAPQKGASYGSVLQARMKGGK